MARVSRSKISPVNEARHDIVSQATRVDPCLRRGGPPSLGFSLPLLTISAGGLALLFGRAYPGLGVAGAAILIVLAVAWIWCGVAYIRRVAIPRWRRKVEMTVGGS